MSVAVIGGGLSGCVAVLSLHQQGIETISLRIFTSFGVSCSTPLMKIGQSDCLTVGPKITGVET